MTEQTTPGGEETVTVAENAERSRFDVLVGDELAGFSRYRDLDPDGGGDGPTQRIFFHTEIDDRFEGRGLASALTRSALTASVEQGRRIVPVCSYVKRWLEGHDDVAGHVDRVRPEHLQALRRD